MLGKNIEVNQMRKNRFSVLLILALSLGILNPSLAVPVGNNVEYIPDQRNLGVGVVNPQAKLDVNGTVMFRGGNPQAGYVLTTDASGLASWSQVDASNISGAVQNAVNATNAINATNVTGGNINNSTFNNGVINGATLVNISIPGSPNLDISRLVNPSNSHLALSINNAGDTVVNGDLQGVGGVFSMDVSASDIIGRDRIRTNSDSIILTAVSGAAEFNRNRHSSGNFRISGETDVNLFFTNSSENAVGIGTANPTEKLHVVGNVRANNFIGDGSGLTGITAANVSGKVANAATADFATAAGTATNATNVSGGTINNSTITGGSITNAGSVTATSFAGSGQGLTNLNANNITSGTIDIARIPNLNASKITSGTFSASLFPILNDSSIPNLDASKITTGVLNIARIPVLDSGRIPNLDASKITTGIFNMGIIPNLTSTKISSEGAPAGRVLTADGSGNSSWQVAAAATADFATAAGTATNALNVSGGTINNSIITGGSITNAGSVTATSFAGSGQGLTNLNANNITSGTIDTARIPNLNASKITSGTFSASLFPTLNASSIPNLDASKITTGVLNIARIPNLDATRIPNLNASKITSGTFSASLFPTLNASSIPNLDASKITTGVLNIARIPNLDATRIPNLNASKITSGTFSASLFPTLNASSIPNLDASKITTGVLNIARIPNLDATRIPNLNASKITSGTFSASLFPTLNASSIPNLDASKITTGVLNIARIPALDSGRIPNLDASKITTGVLSVQRIPVIKLSTLASPNGSIDPAVSVDNLGNVSMAKNLIVDQFASASMGVFSSYIAIGSSDHLIYGGGGGTQFNARNLADATFRVRGVSDDSLFFVKPSNNRVGIGTQNPNEKLEVIGNIKATRFIGDGSGLSNIPADNLGNHTATQNLEMNQKEIVNAKKVSAIDFAGNRSSTTYVNAAQITIGESFTGPGTLYVKQGGSGEGAEVLTEVKTNTGFAQYGTIFQGRKKWLVGSYGDQRTNSSGGPNSFYIFQKTNSSSQIIDQHRLIITNEGNVAIGVNNPQGINHKLYVAGSAAKTSGGANWSVSSDARLKDVHGEYEYGLKEILDLNTVRFSYKKDNARSLPSDTKEIGFIAQEVQKLIPDAVTVAADGYYELNVHPINVAIVNAIKELKAEKDNEIKDLKEQVKLLKELYCLDNPIKAICAN
jgi:hypothetical protein